MAADLKVVSVRLPPRILAPCPTTVIVVIENDGSDPSDPAIFDVTVDIGASDQMSERFVVPVGREARRIQPGARLAVPVEVTFPCLSPVALLATADEARQVPNNVASAPSLRLSGLVTTPVPWLVPTLTVDLLDPGGHHTPSPAAFCPDTDLEVNVVIENRGCATANAFEVDLELLDADAVPPVSYGGQISYLSSIPPGGSGLAIATLRTPHSPAATSGTLTVQITVDSKNDNPDACNRALLSPRYARPFEAVGGPTLELRVDGGGTIHPGEAPALSWSVENACTDIGLADIRILFGNPPVEVHKIQRWLGRQSTVANHIAAADLAMGLAPVANAFWTVGAKTLELEVTGTGADPGPYSVSAAINVVPEIIDQTWWLWTVTTAAFWKSSYPVRGTFLNRGRAPMSVVTLSADEHPLDQAGTGQDQTVVPVATIAGVLVAPGSSAVATWSRRQAWSWLVAGTPQEVGSRARDFSYVASFSTVDKFGNPYATIARLPLIVDVSISPTKMFDLGVGIVLVDFGYVYLIAALAVSGVGPYGWIVAVVLAAAGMAMLIAAAFYVNDANDPPTPDFREPRPPDVETRAWTVPEPERDEFRSLHSLASLLTRVVSARLDTVTDRDRAWAAALDGDDERHQRFGSATRQALDALDRLAAAATAAADESQETLDRILDEIGELPTPDELRAITDRFAEELHLRDAERAFVNDQLRDLDPDRLQNAFDAVRDQGTASIGEVVRMMHEQLSDEFGELDYLA
jgi:hypothetical protein